MKPNKRERRLAENFNCGYDVELGIMLAAYRAELLAPFRELRQEWSNRFAQAKMNDFVRAWVVTEALETAIRKAEGEG